MGKLEELKELLKELFKKLKEKFSFSSSAKLYERLDEQIKEIQDSLEVLDEGQSLSVDAIRELTDIAISLNNKIDDIDINKHIKTSDFKEIEEKLNKIKNILLPEETMKEFEQYSEEELKNAKFFLNETDGNFIMKINNETFKCFLENFEDKDGTYFKIEKTDVEEENLEETYNFSKFLNEKETKEELIQGIISIGTYYEKESEQYKKKITFVNKYNEKTVTEGNFTTSYSKENKSLTVMDERGNQMSINDTINKEGKKKIEISYTDGRGRTENDTQLVWEDKTGTTSSFKFSIGNNKGVSNFLTTPESPVFQYLKMYNLPIDTIMEEKKKLQEERGEKVSKEYFDRFDKLKTAINKYIGKNAFSIHETGGINVAKISIKNCFCIISFNKDASLKNIILRDANNAINLLDKNGNLIPTVQDDFKDIYNSFKSVVADYNKALQQTKNKNAKNVER